MCNTKATLTSEWQPNLNHHYITKAVSLGVEITPWANLVLDIYRNAQFHKWAIGENIVDHLSTIAHQVEEYMLTMDSPMLTIWGRSPAVGSIPRGYMVEIVTSCHNAECGEYPTHDVNACLTGFCVPTSLDCRDDKVWECLVDTSHLVHEDKIRICACFSATSDECSSVLAGE